MTTHMLKMKWIFLALAIASQVVIKPSVYFFFEVSSFEGGAFKSNFKKRTQKKRKTGRHTKKCLNIIKCAFVLFDYI